MLQRKQHTQHTASELFVVEIVDERYWNSSSVFCGGRRTKRGAATALRANRDTRLPLADRIAIRHREARRQQTILRALLCGRAHSDASNRLFSQSAPTDNSALHKRFCSRVPLPSLQYSTHGRTVIQADTEDAQANRSRHIGARGQSTLATRDRSSVSGGKRTAQQTHYMPS